MPKLLGIRIQNFKALADVSLGQTGYGRGDPLPPFICFIGPNGSGKSTLLDAFGFLSDCLRDGVEAACDMSHRGGFRRLRTQGSTGPITFELYFRQDQGSRPITYSFAVDEVDGIPNVVSENLKQRRKNQKSGRPFTFLRLEAGTGEVWSGDAVAVEGEESTARVDVRLDDPTRLGITTLGQLREHPRIVGLRAYMEGWYLSYFLPDAARRLPPTGAQKHLDRTGENLGNFVQYLLRTRPDAFGKVLARIAEIIPGVRNISCEESPDRRLLLRFDEQGYLDPFYQQSMSDGTLKLFAYLLLLEDPEPYAFIGIEEPENGLYHKLLGNLAREFKRHASTGRTQVMVTTHSPYLVDALSPGDVWLIQKNDRGTVDATRTDTIPEITALVSEGLPLGSLWFSNHLHERGF